MVYWTKLLRIGNLVMSFRSLFFIGFWLFALFGCKEGMAQQESNNRFDAEAKNYRFISRDFLYAIYGINLDAFFSKPLPELPKHKMSLTGEEKNKNLMFLYKEHYEQLGNRLCDSINEAYKKMPSPVITRASSYEFDIELTKAMRNAGAYILPLRLNKGKIHASYHDGSANFKNEYFNLPQHQRLSNSPMEIL